MLVNASIVELMQLYASDTLNFQKGFRGELLTTLVLSNRASATFCLAVNSANNYTIGVHPAVFKRLFLAKIKCVYFLKDKPGFFLALFANVDKRREFCFKIQTRQSITELLKSKTNITFQAYQRNTSGSATLSGQSLSVETQCVDQMLWEPRHQLRHH